MLEMLTALKGKVPQMKQTTTLFANTVNKFALALVQFVVRDSRDSQIPQILRVLGVSRLRDSQYPQNLGYWESRESRESTDSQKSQKHGFGSPGSPGVQ